MEEQDYILFEDYLSGNLDENATNAFETRLETDKAFKKSFSIYKDISAHLDHEIGNEEKTMDFRANLDSISHNYFSKLKNKVIRNSIDLEVFNVQNKGRLRTKYSISHDEFAVLFVADDLNNQRKGFDILLT